LKLRIPPWHGATVRHFIIFPYFIVAVTAQAIRVSSPLLMRVRHLLVVVKTKRKRQQVVITITLL